MRHMITHALLSVSDKSGIVEFAESLSKLNILLLSTGGTAKLLKQHHLPVIEICDYTGFPEIMNGRVKTLHPKIYAGILARPDQDQEILTKYAWLTIGLVVVNLYPFEKTIAKEDATFTEAIENIDIGGPTLLRAGAKNFETTTVVVDQQDYATVLAELEETGNTTHSTRFNLAKKVFAHVANYDAHISHYFSIQIQNSAEDTKTKFPMTLTLQLEKQMDLRYGENPHQQAAFYALPNTTSLSITKAKQHLGKPLSYNNIADADTAFACVQQFAGPTCVIVKHANPCAVSSKQSLLSAYEAAYAADSLSAFGGIIAFNQELTQETLDSIIHNQFAEVIIAPAITQDALNCARQKPNLRILTVPMTHLSSTNEFDFKSVNGGLLIQDKDDQYFPPQLDTVTKRQPSPAEIADLLFAWQVVRFVKSNAIVYVKDKTTVGIGAGQMSRVFSCKIAEEKAQEAGLSLQGAVMASDAFLPFRDSIDHAAQVGISVVIQPGGSIRDQDVIDAANEHNIAMVFTHKRHFRH